MTLFNHETMQATSLAKLDIWRCDDGCGFHVRAGNVVLTLTDPELVAFLKAAGGLYLGENCAHLSAEPDSDLTHTRHADFHADDHNPRTLTSELEH